jgi:acetyl/propionyl-CoA carboxylase alpha subunit
VTRHTVEFTRHTVEFTRHTVESRNVVTRRDRTSACTRNVVTSAGTIQYNTSACTRNVVTSAGTIIRQQHSVHEQSECYTCKHTKYERSALARSNNNNTRNVVTSRDNNNTRNVVTSRDNNNQDKDQNKAKANQTNPSQTTFKMQKIGRCRFKFHKKATKRGIFFSPNSTKRPTN